MHCPKCNQQSYQLSKPCPACQFSGDSALVEELSHIDWLFNEKELWQSIGQELSHRLQQKYGRHRKKIEIKLGLRLPPFTNEEAIQAVLKLTQLETLIKKIDEWQKEGSLDGATCQTFIEQTQQELNELLERLDDHPARSTSRQTEQDQLSLTTFLLEAIDRLSQNNGFATLAKENQVRTPLLAEQNRLEIRLGLRPEPVQSTSPEKEPLLHPDIVEQKIEMAPEQAAVSQPMQAPIEILTKPEFVAVPEAVSPRPPFRERLWEMLLSERTLQGMLFMGIFLLFSAAISFVAWGWKDFSAPLRVAIPTGFTGAFFALGWYVRTKTPMYRSGVALSAIAALLIPIDFYTIYINFHIPSDYRTLFWLGTSIVCLIAYTFTTLIIRSQFFGYLVGIAAGNMVLALIEMGHEIFGLSLDWRSAGLSGLCLGLIFLATILNIPRNEVKLQTARRIFANPFRILALYSISIIMIFTFGWRIIERESYDSLHYALTVNWWLGSFIFGWSAIQFRSRRLGFLAMVSIPISAYLMQAVLFDRLGIDGSWHAFGWAWLTPAYLGIGHRLLNHKESGYLLSQGRTVTRIGVALIFVAALWPLGTIAHDTAAAASSHVVLAGAVVLATLLWRQPHYLYGASMLCFSSITFAMADMGLPLAQLSVGWATLAIAHIILALNLGNRFPMPISNMSSPLVIAGYVTAGLAILPTILPYHGNLLAYTLGNWLALGGWGARLAHLKQPGFVNIGFGRKSTLHWLTALPLPIWLWIVLDNIQLSASGAAFALAILAWMMLLLSVYLARVIPTYRWPWYLTGLLVSIVAPAIALATSPTSFNPGLVLLMIGGLYFTDAVINRQSQELAPAGLITAWGYWLMLDYLAMPAEIRSFCLVWLIVSYILGGIGAGYKNPSIFTKQFLAPLYITAQFITLISLVGIYIFPFNSVVINTAWTDRVRLWQAVSQLLLAGIFGVYAWHAHKEKWGHLATWLSAAGLSFIVITVSTHSGGSIAAELGLIAVLFVLVERGLYQLQAGRNFQPGIGQPEFIRFTWRLFRRPLLTTGWVISGGVIGLALFYNLWWLGDRIEQIWASCALLLVTGLYALAARLFRQVRFVWLAAWLSIAPWTVMTEVGWFTFSNYPDPTIYVLSWSILAWILFCLNQLLKRLNYPAYAGPLKVVMHALLLFSLLWSATYYSPENLTQALGLLSIGLLYFLDVIIDRKSLRLIPGGLFTAWGYLLLLAHFGLSFDILSLALALLIGVYVLGGLQIEKTRSAIFTHHFLAPLYLTTHVIVLTLLWRIFVRPSNWILFGTVWTDDMRLWGASAQFVLGVVYGLYAWGSFKERWGHFAAWLVTSSIGFIAVTYSRGSGLSTVMVALAAIIFVLAERKLYWLRRDTRIKSRKQAFFRLSWRLYWRPLLVAGWLISAGTIGLALIRNLLLVGSETSKVWAVVALLLITVLYIISARIFRQVRFLWLAAALIFVPWTILTNLGWFTPYRPTWSGYALGWILLGWLLLIVSLKLNWREVKPYAWPLTVIANIYILFSLVWGLPDVDTARITFALAIGFYGLGALKNYQAARSCQQELSAAWQTKFLYPGLSLIPIWSVYLLAWLSPAARFEHYGLLLLMFGPLGVIMGQGLHRIAPDQRTSTAYAFPAYLTGYIALMAGTLLVAGNSALLALVLLFDAALMMVSAWLFKKPVWVYVAALCLPLSLWLTLQTTFLSMSRYGWWLIGLASIYLTLSWILRRINLLTFSQPLLITSFGLTPVGLSFSSLDQTGALWGYSTVALLYALVALWLHQPLLLTPATGLSIVPFIILLQNSPLAPEFYGLALFMGAIAAVSMGLRLDLRYGSFQDFPWKNPAGWFVALVNRLLEWWAFPLFIGGFALASISPFFTAFKPGLTALNFFLLIPFFVWAIYYFRLRIWLMAAALAGHLGMIFYLAEINWWAQSNSALIWLGFLPVTLFMALVTLFIERYRKETPLLQTDGNLNGWSHLLYIMLLFDIMFGQILSLNGTYAAVTISLTHTVLIGIIASFWLTSRVVYVSISLGLLALGQFIIASNGSLKDLAVALSQLAFAYGLGGYGLAFIRSSLDKRQKLRPWLEIWELPLQRFGIGLSFGTLVLTCGLGTELVTWSTRALFGLSYRNLVQLDTIQMLVGVFGFIGLLYVAAAFTHRWARLGYVAIGMLLAAWMLHVFYIQQWDDFRRVQWYAMPVGIYLLTIGYMEWQQHNKGFARWLDYVAMILMLGSLFWQTLLFGWLYALLLGSEGLAAFFWGSSRRLRRFLYAGMSSVILATMGQLLNSLRSINQWIVFGIIGLLLVFIAIVIERKLEDIKAWHEVLETWE